MLLVSCYYNIPSKKSKDFYYSQIKNFFNFLSDDIKIIFFTDKENYDELKNLAKNNVQFIIRPFESLRVFSEFNKEFWNRQVERDVEKYHTWQLAALWANKKYFVQEVSELFSENEWYLWIDSGCIRDKSWEKTCINFTKRNCEIEEAVYVQLLNNIPNNKIFFEYPDMHTAGALILFHKNLISKFINDYNDMLRIYDLNNICGNSDQYIMSSLIIKNQTNIKPILYESLSNKIKETIFDRWFFFLGFF